MPFWEGNALKVDVDIAIGFVVPYTLLPESAKKWEERVKSDKVKSEIRRRGARFYAKTSKATGKMAKDLRFTLDLEPLLNTIPAFKRILVILKASIDNLRNTSPAPFHVIMIFI